MTDYLLPIADQNALRWIVQKQRTAFASHRAEAARKLEVGDRLFLYSTRGCFNNPTRDRGRVFGLASVAEPATDLSQPITFGGREFPIGVRLSLVHLAPLRSGVALAPLVRDLRTFPDPDSWSARLRRALVPLDAADARLLERRLREEAPRYPDALPSYES